MKIMIWYILLNSCLLNKEDEIDNVLKSKDNIENNIEIKKEEENKAAEYSPKKQFPTKQENRPKIKEYDDINLLSPSSDSKEMDYKEQLRRSLETGSKRFTNVNYDNNSDNSDHNILSPDDSSDSAIKQKEFIMSPLHEKYANFEEFKLSTMKKQREMEEEIKKMSEQQFDLVNQLSNNLGNFDNYGDEDTHK